MDPDQLISFHIVSVSKNRIYLGSAGQGLIWYLHKCIYYNIVTLFILTSIRFYFTLLAGNFLIFLSSAVFFKINLLYSSQRVKQFGFRSGPIFCWSWFGSKTVCRQQLQAKRNFSSVYLTNLQGTTYLYAFASKVENNIHPDQLASGPGKCLGILSSAVFSKLIYYIDYHIEHHQRVKQFGSRSGLTFCRSWSGLNCLQRLSADNDCRQRVTLAVYI